MDSTKLRFLAGAGGLFFGFAGLTALTIALAVILVPVLGLALAIVTVGCLMLSIALFCFYLFLRPDRSSNEEIDSLENATASALADLPFDTMKAVFEKRPITTTAVALLAGYAIVRNPKQTGKSLERLLLALM